MNTPLRFGLLDDLLFLVALFAPVSLLLAGSFALAALGCAAAPDRAGCVARLRVGGAPSVLHAGGRRAAPDPVGHQPAGVGPRKRCRAPSVHSQDARAGADARRRPAA